MSRSKPSILNSRKNSIAHPTTEKHTIQHQLEAAQQQIATLRDQNAILTSRVKELQQQNKVYKHQEQSLKLLTQELQFRKEQQISMDSIILNYEKINAQLTEKLFQLEHQLYAKPLPPTAEVTLIEGESFEEEQSSINPFKNSFRRRSSSLEKKENHAITPKSQVKFSLTHLFDDQIPGKKKTAYHNYIYGMIRRVAKYTFSLALKQPSALQRSSHPYEHLAGKSTRVELQILIKHQIPDLVSNIDALPLFKSMLDFNPYLANGGFEFQEFPLVKLLHIGLKMLEENQHQKEIWIKFQQTVRGRLHRCTTEEHMKLLYIMLKIWPFFQFKIDFITSICLGLKKQIPIMNDQQLKCLFRITSTGWNCNQKFTGNILFQIQKAVLNKVIARWEQRITNIKSKHLSLDSLYLWISLSLSLSFKNNLYELFLEKRAVKLAHLFTEVYQKAIINQIKPSGPQISHLSIALHLLSIFQPINHLFLLKIQKKQSEGEPLKQNLIWNEQYTKLAGSILNHGRMGIQKILGSLESPKTLRQMLIILGKQSLETMLETTGELQIKQNQQVKFPRISKLVEKTMKSSSTDSENIEDKIALLAQLIKQNILDWQISQLYYQSIPIETIAEISMSTAFCLFQIQLTFYAFSSIFQPSASVNRLLLNFLEDNLISFRNFDWLSFNYLRLSIKMSLSSQSSHTLSLNSIEKYQFLSGDSQNIKIFNKILREVKQADSRRLIEEEKHIYSTNPQISSVKKFFIEVRLHQMQPLEPIISGFSRLPHFANINKKIAVNAYTKPELDNSLVLLQKKMLNDLGWKVINLQLPDFLNLSLSQKVELMEKNIEKEQLLLKKDQKQLLS